MAEEWQTPEYTNQEDIYNQQQAGEQQALLGQQQYTQNTYAQQRQGAINSYQDALDQINYGMRQVGVQTREGSAQRGLYDASGQLSGIGQGVASTAIEPLVRQTRTLSERQSGIMQGIATEETNALSQITNALNALPTKYGQAKLDLKNSILAEIKRIAENKASSDKE